MINHRIACVDLDDAVLQAQCMIAAGNHNSEPGGGANAAVIDRITPTGIIPTTRQAAAHAERAHVLSYGRYLTEPG